MSLGHLSDNRQTYLYVHMLVRVEGYICEHVTGDEKWERDIGREVGVEAHCLRFCRLSVCCVSQAFKCSMCTFTVGVLQLVRQESAVWLALGVVIVVGCEFCVRLGDRDTFAETLDPSALMASIESGSVYAVVIRDGNEIEWLGRDGGNMVDGGGEGKQRCHERGYELHNGNISTAAL